MAKRLLVGNSYAAEITDTNLQSHPRAAFVAPGKVVGEPADDARKRRVDGAGRDEDTAVDDSGV